VSEDSRGLARSIRAAQAAIGAKIIESHHDVWPIDVDVTYTVVQRNGKARVQFSPPPVKESGWADQ
jgi:hypothetical protein